MGKIWGVNVGRFYMMGGRGKGGRGEIRFYRMGTKRYQSVFIKPSNVVPSTGYKVTKWGNSDYNMTTLGSKVVNLSCLDIIRRIGRNK